MKSIPEPIFTPAAENIKANREDERKTLLDGFAGRLRTISHKALRQKCHQLKFITCSMVRLTVSKTKRES
ncbi:hypothetical protein [Morganella morganii]|uniref:hypothetical protein n=1 Tax=Morganella morganii TaxID=582 RepID=UPI003AAD89F0